MGKPHDSMLPMGMAITNGAIAGNLRHLRYRPRCTICNMMIKTGTVCRQTPQGFVHSKCAADKEDKERGEGTS